MKKSLCCFNVSNKYKKLCWEITNDCNFNCEYCFSNSSGVPVDLSTEHIENAINNIKLHNIDYVILSGGEPLLCSKIYYIITALTKNNIRTSLCTNASLANEQTCKKLYSCGLRKITVSFDDLDKNEFNIIKRRKTAYPESINGIKSFISNNFEVTINTVIQRKNINYIKDIVVYWKNNGVKKFSFSIPVCKNIDSNYSVEQINRIENYLTEIEKELDVEITFCCPQCEKSTCMSNELIFGMHTNCIIDKCLVKEFIE